MINLYQFLFWKVTVCKQVFKTTHKVATFPRTQNNNFTIGEQLDRTNRKLPETLIRVIKLSSTRQTVEISIPYGGS